MCLLQEENQEKRKVCKSVVILTAWTKKVKNQSISNKELGSDFFDYCSCEWVLSNYPGVRQGGIPCPCYCVVYLVELSSLLSVVCRTNYCTTMTTMPGTGQLQQGKLIQLTPKISQILLQGQAEKKKLVSYALWGLPLL